MWRSLGHLISLLHINDIPNCSDNCVKSFADDTNIFAPIFLKCHRITKLNQDLNELSINLKKTNYMVIKLPRKTNITWEVELTDK